MDRQEGRKIIDETLIIRLPEELKRDFRVRAAEHGISMAEAARRAIEEWISKPAPQVPA